MATLRSKARQLWSAPVHFVLEAQPAFRPAPEAFFPAESQDEAIGRQAMKRPDMHKTASWFRLSGASDRKDSRKESPGIVIILFCFVL